VGGLERSVGGGRCDLSSPLPFRERCPKALIRFFPSFFKKPLPPPPSEKKNRNKLGATLANAGRAHEAAAAYRKALDAKPNYVRAWTNMG